MRHLPEDQDNKGSLQKTHWRSHTSSWTFWWPENSRSQRSQWRMWISKQSSIRCPGTRFGNLIDSILSVQEPKLKLLRKHQRACKSSWSRPGNQKSFTLTRPWNLAKLVKNYLGIIVRQHRTDRKRKWDLLKERHAELKKGYLLYYCNQVWMKMVGGFHGMLLLSAKHSTSLVSWEDTIWKSVRITILWPGYPRSEYW